MPQRPIITDLQGRIVDGLHRYRACLKLGIEPKFERRDLTDDEARALSISENLHRRHLTPGQRAAIAEENATRTRGGDQTANLRIDLSMAESAKALGASKRSAETVREVRKKAPELLPDIKAGNLAPHVAKQIANLPKREREEAIGKVKRGDVQGAKVSAKAAKSSHVKKATAPTIPSPGKNFHPDYAEIFEQLDHLPRLLVEKPLTVDRLEELSNKLADSVTAVAKARRSQLDAAQNEPANPAVA